MASVHLQVGRWCREHLVDAQGNYPTLAAFDIGMVKFVYAGKVLDIGGLCEPEILPFLHQGDLRPYLRAHGIRYLALGHSYREEKDLTELTGLAGEGVDNVRLVRLTEPFAYPRESLMRHYFAVGNAFPIMVVSRIEWLR